MYAIVDIETTGGNPSISGITEICVVITDGTTIHQVYETFVNPGTRIPGYITSLTGITDDMIENAPSFANIANDLYHLLHDKVFVAHNVNFDYSFLKSAFGSLGFSFNPMKLCTVKLARKAFPQRKSYSLGNICSSLGIEISNRHRAGGDAMATAELFGRCLNNIGHEQILKMARTSVRKIQLPPGLDEKVIATIPETPGIYHFLGDKGKRLYTGKANNLRKRIHQHFDVTRGKSAIQLEKVLSLDWEECGNELISLLEEAVAINKYWPEWNVAGKSIGSKYALIHYKTGSGMVKLQTEKRRKGSITGIPFPRLGDAQKMLSKLIGEHDLCPVLIRMNGTCFTPGCYCSLEKAELVVSEHNERVFKAINSLTNSKDKVIITGPGRISGEYSITVIENGAVKGWGFIDSDTDVSNPEIVIAVKPDLPETRDIINAFLRKEIDGRIGQFKILKTQKQTI